MELVVNLPTGLTQWYNAGLIPEGREFEPFSATFSRPLAGTYLLGVSRTPGMVMGTDGPAPWDSAPVEVLVIKWFNLVITPFPIYVGPTVVLRSGIELRVSRDRTLPLSYGE